MKYIWLTFILLILVAVGGLVWRFGMTTSIAVNLNSPACSDPVLTTAPTSDDNIDSITPLGNISLPGHALATNHTYYVLKRGADGLPLDTEVLAPADLFVGKITHIASIRDGQLRDNDYKVDMVPCRNVGIQFDHLRTLSPRLATAYANRQPKCKTNQRASDRNMYCDADMNIKLTAGELIGVAGGSIPTGFDFGATDGRLPKLEFANNKRYRSSYRQTACPYDLFGPAIKVHLYRFIGSNDQRRTIEPICGTVTYDLPGTVQGNWYFGKGGSDELERQGKTLALIYDNVDPKLGLIVLGSIFNKIVFVPTQSGLVNRDFAAISPGSSIYCYQPDASGSRVSYGIQNQFKGSALIRLSSTAELDVEIRPEDCGSHSVFSQPTRFIR